MCQFVRLFAVFPIPNTESRCINKECVRDSCDNRYYSMRLEKVAFLFAFELENVWNAIFLSLPHRPSLSRFLALIFCYSIILLSGAPAAGGLEIGAALCASLWKNRSMARNGIGFIYHLSLVIPAPKQIATVPINRSRSPY